MNNTQHEAIAAKFLLGILGLVGIIIFPPLALLLLVIWLYHTAFLKNR